MATTTPKMGLRVWNDPNDPYDHDQQADNLAKIDFHDHGPGRGHPLSAEAILDGSITAAKLAVSAIDDIISDGVVTEPKLADLAVSTRTLQGGAVTAAKIGPNAIIAGKIAPGVITDLDISTSAAIAESKLALASDAVAGTASRRTLGTGSTQAAAGNDARLSDQRSPKGPETNLKIIRGTINADGTILHGSGFSCAHSEAGKYTVAWDTAFSSSPTVVATPVNGFSGEPTISLNAPGSTANAAFRLRRAGVLSDDPFSFIAIGPA